MYNVRSSYARHISRGEILTLTHIRFTFTKLRDAPNEPGAQKSYVRVRDICLGTTDDRPTHTHMPMRNQRATAKRKFQFDFLPLLSPLPVLVCGDCCWTFLHFSFVRIYVDCICHYTRCDECVALSAYTTSLQHQLHVILLRHGNQVTLVRFHYKVLIQMAIWQKCHRKEEEEVECIVNSTIQIMFCSHSTCAMDNEVQRAKFRSVHTAHSMRRNGNGIVKQ